jgi:hypothetical protein
VRHVRSLTVLAAALPLALLPAATAQAAPPTSGTYLALGDSVAVGTGATDPATQGYVGLLHADLRADCGKDRAGHQHKSGQKARPGLTGRTRAVASSWSTWPRTAPPRRRSSPTSCRPR